MLISVHMRWNNTNKFAVPKLNKKQNIKPLMPVRNKMFWADLNYLCYILYYKKWTQLSVSWRMLHKWNNQITPTVAMVFPVLQMYINCHMVWTISDARHCVVYWSDKERNKIIHIHCYKCKNNWYIILAVLNQVIVYWILIDIPG